MTLMSLSAMAILHQSRQSVEFTEFRDYALTSEIYFENKRLSIKSRYHLFRNNCHNLLF